jgi:hypothetical protein
MKTLWDSPIKLNRMRKTIGILALLFMAFGIRVHAQEQQQYNAWNALFTSYSLTASNSLLLETHYRTKEFYGIQDQILIRPSFRRKISKNATLSVGYTFISNGVGVSKVNENNLWEQLFVSYPITRRINLFGWIRAEHRWIDSGTVDFSTRLRFRNGFNIPLNKGGIRLIAYNETFLNFSNSFPVLFNQNWSYIGFSKKLKPNLRLQTGYQRTSVNKNYGVLAKNIWFTILFWDLP